MPLPEWAHPSPRPPRRRGAARAPEDEPLFGSPREALMSAYTWEMRASPKLSAVFRDMRSTTRPLPSRHGLGASDLVAQAGLTQRLARSVLTPLGWAAIEAWHIRVPSRQPTRAAGKEEGSAAAELERRRAIERDPIAREARRRKILALHMLYTATAPRAAPPPRATRFALITAQVWCGLRLTGPTVGEWADQYNVSPPTISRWASGPEEHRRKPGLVRLFDAELAAAEGALAEPFAEAGLVP